MIYAFGPYQLDTSLYELRHQRRPCKLEPRVFDVLRYLIQHRDQVVTREELLDHLWPGQYISEAILSNYIMAARKALGDSGHWQRLIKTVHGRGYRFIAPVEEQAPALPSRDPLVRAATPLVPAPLGPTAVAPVPTVPEASHTFQDILAGEQGYVTVLCGMLALGEGVPHGVGVDEMQRLRQTFFALAWDEAQRHDGLHKFFGTDGVLMLFGLPRAPADHAPRAVRAALGLHHRLHAWCTARLAVPPDAVTVRIGVHTGPMALHHLTDPAGFTSLATAETTTLAIWLQYHATAGVVLLSKATLPLVHEVVPCVEHGAVRLPGHVEPIMAYRIRGQEG
ncbi:MAG: winged helix-turn-helix domain-containing protein [Candidatus Tectimicrobiota bacterium]